MAFSKAISMTDSRQNGAPGCQRRFGRRHVGYISPCRKMLVKGTSPDKLQVVEIDRKL